MTLIDNVKDDADSLNAELGAEAARLIWDDASEVESICDPRTPAFARAMIDASVAVLQSSRGLIKKMIDRAAASAEDLAVAQFQGIIEVIQNADDVRATEVRFALRNTPHGGQLLIVHNGEPVTCRNVLGMALPYLTTKAERTDQRGRFGIGLKTLKRIATSVAVHSAPYHFSGDQLRFGWIEPEASIPGFYDPTTDTILVVGLNDEFDEGELTEWFDAWQDEGLLFLASVSRLRWCELDGTTRKERILSFSQWTNAGYDRLHPGVLELRVRRVEGPANHWIVWRATVSVPLHLHPAHKARSETTDISVALADGEARPGLFIGFRSQVPLTLPFSLDAQFDPSTSREAIIENPWNNWLIDRAAEVVADVACGLLAMAPRSGWALVPLESEGVGKDDDPWLRGRFASAFTTARDWLRKSATLALRDTQPKLVDVTYEDEALSGFLTEADIERIASDKRAVQTGVRDEAGRWREVLDTLDVSTVVGTDELLEALEGKLFADKMPEWWVEAGARLVVYHAGRELFGKRFLLSDEHGTIACHAAGHTEKPLVFDAAPSAFAARWKLLERLHPAYGANDSGKAVVDWLTANAAFTSHIDAGAELAAFAQHIDGKAIEITDEELRDLRARFDGVSDRRVEQLGPRVGAGLLLDGYIFKKGKAIRQKVAVSAAYLCKTLDGENSTWPDAAGATPDVPWIAARYEAVLKTNAGRWAKRKRDDGFVSRGPRRFLTLLGAEITPRIVKTEGPIFEGTDTRIADLRRQGAERVEYDLRSPDLSRVLRNLRNLNKRDAKLRSPALLRTFARNWERVYAGRRAVPAQHKAIKYVYARGEVAAVWLNELRDTPWVAVGRGELVEPQFAVLRTPETQTLYQTFACEVARGDVPDGLATALSMIIDVRISDLVARVKELRDGGEEIDEAQLLEIYRAIAKRCPRVVIYNTPIGDMTAQQLRQKFLDGDGLIYLGDGRWRRPDEVMRGMDIFHNRRRFVPGGAACATLWIVLGVAEPDLVGCIRFCRELAQEPYGAEVEAILMDVYRYMERLVDTAERKIREKLRNMPLSCSGEWVSARPIYYVDNGELRGELVNAVPGLKCWTPPCDIRDFARLAELMAVDTLEPELSVVGGRDDAIERGEHTRLRFGYAADHLSAELARSDPETRDRIAVSWDQLKSVALFVYDDVIAVRASSPGLLPPGGIIVSVKALACERPREFHLRNDNIGDRDFGGRVIASLFPFDVRRRIDGEWALAWQKSRDTAAQATRLASDERRAEAMQEAAHAINAGPKGKIKVTPPQSRNPAVKPRTLKEAVGAVVSATVQQGTTQNEPAVKPLGGGLKSRMPEPSKPNGAGNLAGSIAYTIADLEQRGWEVLVQALETSSDQNLVDFRNRHGVGADGVFDWKRFVEMKATARGPQTQVELSNNEFERAKQRGSDFILALVSGLETGQKDEVRLIFDPVNCATVRPSNGVRLVGLLEAPAVIIHFEEGDQPRTQAGRIN